MSGLAGEGRTIFLSRYVLAEAAQTVDHVVVIGRGRLVIQSPLADLTAQAAPAVRIRTPDPARLQAVVSADGGQARLTGGDQVEVTGSTPRRVAELAARESIPVVESITEQASPEDVFFRLTRAEAPAPAEGDVDYVTSRQTLTRLTVTARGLRRFWWSPATRSRPDR